ncbi:3-oxoacyl-[acyl-carrier-protein] reductase [Solitalea canadensis]|uniref:3-oxoacyl-[acyl-carrier-protein] reductase n=1 Tax=Solitalea canadensis (strain ATCC 29591 / DSM 3403 / JCM 21819 / LMG 8368 / NBRC 15130 / NCIMB 12057 / USAM 9D) TaxID=929556 RepID=H8KSX2_SOLCM|nr:3-oxoacyl-[acyl-carrier-protein] reductase [Solitalea canadensis]AFD05432.1 3-oxoacyl-(acyl-carrier-protein) reductase [Solitalea canadensis DSM 3403]
MKLLEGKVALITGASKGIGRKIAELYAKNGAQVAFTYLSSVEKGQALEQELQQFGTKVKGYRSDASDYAAAEQLINDIVAEFGKIDIVVNNAGITKDGLLMRMTEEQWDEVLRVNLKSIFNVTKAASKPMMKQRYGVFVNMSSIVGLQGNAGQANYAASKAGIIGFTKSIAKELGSRNIRANVVCPGFIKTEMTEVLPAEQVAKWSESIPLKRMGETEDVANLAVFLGSEMSAYITGQSIAVCGGMES